MQPSTKIYQDEIFGPVLVVLRANTLEDAIALVNRNPYANGTAIFTESRGARRASVGLRAALAGAVGGGQPLTLRIQ